MAVIASRTSMLRLLALVASACTVETAVLSRPDAGPAIATCVDAFGRGVSGDPCALDLKCDEPAKDDPCCRELALCPDGKLVRDRVCGPQCAPCLGDDTCPPDRPLCDGVTCQACPDLSGCAPCPDGWTRLERHGCTMCTCAPPGSCTDPGQCGPTEACYPGALCAEGCPPGDLSCCANVCASAEPKCAIPAPLGCKQECPPELNCTECAAIACECIGGQWACEPGCGLTTGACALPPPPAP